MTLERTIEERRATVAHLKAADVPNKALIAANERMIYQLETPLRGTGTPL